GQRDDERSSSLNNAFYYLISNFNPKFYLLGPNIDGISPGFEETYNAVFYKSSFSLVDSREINIYEEYKKQFGKKGKKKQFKENVLFELLESLKEEQTIIYCSSPARVRYLSKAFSEYLKSNNFSLSSNTYDLIPWIKTYISNDWAVINCLNYDIGIHDGALQKHITTTIIDYFNKGLVKYLFCTSTIIEGVNTSAKNIVYYDEMKGPNPIDYFDYSNIKGRAGRMMVHYIGRIYNFNPPPEKRI
ncbi:MAG: helicase, partial [Bacteroides sp.]|nr:helicase [Bacteroides sp.]